jgi:hypothetical protein
MSSQSYIGAKRDANGRLIVIPMEKDGRGNFRPAGGSAAGTARANQYVSTCRSCGGNNYSSTYSTCSRCG